MIMTEKEVQKLKRVELLEILIEQGEEIEKLKSELEDAKKQLENRRICIENAGSIAEASFQLNGIFDAAQSAAQQYLENIQYLNENQERICAEMEKKSKDKCEALERETTQRCQELERETTQKCQAMENETAQLCKNMIDEAKKGADKQWKEVSEKLENFYDAHKGLRELLALVGGVPNSQS